VQSTEGGLGDTDAMGHPMNSRARAFLFAYAFVLGGVLGALLTLLATGQ
jgi:hypothetical protein